MGCCPSGKPRIHGQRKERERERGIEQSNWRSLSIPSTTVLDEMTTLRLRELEPKLALRVHETSPVPYPRNCTCYKLFSRARPLDSTSKAKKVV